MGAIITVHFRLIVYAYTLQQGRLTESHRSLIKDSCTRDSVHRRPKAGDTASQKPESPAARDGESTMLRRRKALWRRPLLLLLYSSLQCSSLRPTRSSKTASDLWVSVAEAPTLPRRLGKGASYPTYEMLASVNTGESLPGGRRKGAKKAPQTTRHSLAHQQSGSNSRNPRSEDIHCPVTLRRKQPLKELQVEGLSNFDNGNSSA